MPEQAKGVWRYLLAGLLVLALGYFAVHRPLAAACVEARQAARAAEAQVTLIRQDKAAHMDSGQSDKRLTEEKRTADAALPDVVDTSALLAELQHTALQQGVQLTAVLPQEAQPQGEVWRQSVQVKCEADYFSLLNFLRALEAQGRFWQLDEAHLTSTGGRLRGELRFSAFALPPAGEVEP